MSAEDVFPAAMARYNEGGIDAFLEYAAPDIVWHAPPEYPEGQDWHGRETVAKAWHQQFDSVFEEVRVDLGALEAGPKHYLATVRGHGRAHGSRMELDWVSYFVGTPEDGLFKELWVFSNRDEARLAAGLEP
jgi:ketosteroid isomerase-like protein